MLFMQLFDHMARLREGRRIGSEKSASVQQFKGLEPTWTENALFVGVPLAQAAAKRWTPQIHYI